MEGAIRLGMLGCGSVGEYAVIAPAQDDGAIDVSAVASRYPEKSAAYARHHGIARSFGSYQSLLDAQAVDAVYIALPNALHHYWVIAALEAGYPVLCEKPLACNAQEAKEMVDAARAAGVPLVEAFHWRHHPLAARTMHWLESGAIGEVVRIEAYFHIAATYLKDGNIRMDPALGGGSTLDQGCYCVDLLRFFGKADPAVLSASGRWSKRGVDLGMESDLLFPDGTTAAVATSMDAAGDAIRCGAVFHGTRGRLTLDNPFLPHLGSSIVMETPDGTATETPTTTPSYVYQARAFAHIVRAPATAPDMDHSIAGMRIMDEILRHAAGNRPKELSIDRAC